KRDPVEDMTVTPTDSPAAHAQEAPTLESTLSTGMRPEVSPAGAEEATLVVGALRALRRDHHVPSAIRQLEAYRRRFPVGELAEEVLALAIEAFAALDDAAARSLADEYLRRFPGGRFSDQ